MARKKPPTRITVKCRSVPFDMMRYDRCCPFTEGDSYKLERLRHGFGDGEAQEVEFLSFAEHAPTIARWKSFGCEVLKSEPYHIG